MVKIVSQVAFYCRLTALISNLNGVERLKRVWECYLDLEILFKTT